MIDVRPSSSPTPATWLRSLFPHFHLALGLTPALVLICLSACLPACAAGLASNCSCNCLAPKVVLLAEGWPQADQFVAAFKSELAQLPLPAPYYPGLRQRYQAFKQHYPQASSSWHQLCCMHWPVAAALAAVVGALRRGGAVTFPVRQGGLAGHHCAVHPLWVGALSPAANPPDVWPANGRDMQRPHTPHPPPLHACASPRRPTAFPACPYADPPLPAG